MYVYIFGGGVINYLIYTQNNKFLAGHFCELDNTLMSLKTMFDWMLYSIRILINF